MSISHEQAEQLPQNLFLLERSGRYEEAVSEVENIWEDKTKVPLVEEYKPRLSAEIVLRCGSVFGFLGHNKQIPNSQKISKDILIEARNRYLDICDMEKVAECENYIALSYWRTGELVEAETWIDEALSHDLPNLCNAIIYSILTKTVILIAKENFEQTLLELVKVQKIMKDSDDAFLKGSFCTNAGIALMFLERNQEALKQFELARKYHQESNHLIYLGTVENNLAYLHKEEKYFSEAHQAVDNAIKIYKQINDKTRNGSSLDTKAQIYLVEEKYDEALECSDKAIKILEKSENSAYLVEAYLTKIKTLIALNDLFQALYCLAEAIELAKNQIGKDASDKIVSEIEGIIKKRFAPVIKNVFGEKQIIVEGFEKELYEGIFDNDLIESKELALPIELKGYGRLDGVLMSNNHFKEIGLEEGSVAIIAEDAPMENGDLAAIMEITSEFVHCGYYSTDMGFVSIEKPDAEVQLFNENEIMILGKIVGVGNSKDKQGRLIIRPI